MIQLRHGVALLAALATSVCVAQKLPLEILYKPLAYPQLVLSPSGRYVAALYPANGTTNLAVVDLATKTTRQISGFSRPDKVVMAGWDTDERIVYGLEAVNSHAISVYNIVAIDRDGKNPLFLVDNMNPLKTSYRNERFVDWSQDDANSILIATDAERHEYPAVYRVNTTSAWHEMQSAAGKRNDASPTRRDRIVAAPARMCDYLTDNAGVVRVCTTTETNDSHRVLYRADAKSEWTEVASAADITNIIQPLAFTADNRRLYVFSNSGRDTHALFEFDPQAHALGKLAFEVPGVDLTEPIWSVDQRQLIGVGYYTDGGHVHYFDAAAAQLQKDLQEVFPEYAVGIANFSKDGKLAIVLVDNDRTPGKFYLYDGRTEEVHYIVDRAPWIDAKQMAHKKAIQYQARDGLSINGYLTIPKDRDAKDLPLIVYPHGGPYGIRDVSGWDRDAQFFASRGYAVLQVNFRGSAGYGTQFQTAGFREWGGKMQDDITDGVEWAVHEGIADKGRVCIFGASYGGYAALMGAVTTPDLYRCAISYSGVSDLESIFRTTVRGDDVYRTRSRDELAFWNRVVGDRHDSEYLRQRSPLYNVAKIHAPIFIAHGENDLIVPFDNATKMRNALRDANKTVEFLSKPNEGHGFQYAENEIELFGRIEQFLQKYNPAQ